MGYAKAAISFPCPDCQPHQLCLTCCGIGIKHMDECYPTTPEHRVHLLESYRKFMEEGT